MKIGQKAVFKRKIDQKDVKAFARLSGDTNPLHLSKTFASKTQFKKPIVHGMFLGALCSKLVGVYLPGKRCLYLSQEIAFRSPVFIGDTVEVRGEVLSFSQSTGVGEVGITINRGKTLCAEGLAKVKVI